jgi:hypothetical protein
VKRQVILLVAADYVPKDVVGVCKQAVLRVAGPPHCGLAGTLQDGQRSIQEAQRQLAVLAEADNANAHIFGAFKGEVLRVARLAHCSLAGTLQDGHKSMQEAQQR